MDSLKLGMIGLDTSHCEAFANLLHDEKDPHHVPGARIVAAYPGGSDAFSLSRERVGKITAALRDTHGVAIHDSIETMAEGMDAFLLESVDGRQHREQFEALAAYGKPVFIDKPFACSRADAEAIAEIAAARNVPVLTASAIRYAAGIAELRRSDAPVHGCEAFGPMAILEDYPGFFWYGIHSAEVLFSFMGKGCRAVRTVHAEGCDLLVGEWEDGRLGTVRGTRFEGSAFGCTVFRGDGVVHAPAAGDPPYYAMLLREMVPFLRGGAAPIDLAESVEIVAFLEAAMASCRKNGEPVPLRG